MDTIKLALKYLRAQREALDSKRALLDKAITALEALIESMNGNHTEVILETRRLLGTSKSGGYVDLAVSVLKEHKKPMALKDLVFEIGQLKGADIRRGPLEGTIAKHVKRTANPRIEKLGPGIYGLPGWPQKTKDLWSKIHKQ